ncbi:heterokaryon incompatibility protein-domain-containing protein [Rhexocercosporidium sp. MPI-PUGE-AT-0058]|nr:heterokaryon incompatibility protein-domain-containing protein [Rhexocercosporidium sp. MPI-PUGE-AT-0058]
MSTQSHLVNVKEGHLCPRCQIIFSLTPSSDDGALPMKASYDTNSTIQQLKSAMRDGCYICNELLRKLGASTHGNLNQIQIYYEMLILGLGWSDLSDLEAIVRVEGSEEKLADVNLTFKKIEDEEAVLFSVPVLGASTESKETVDFVRRKLSHCDAHHSLCAKSRHAHYPLCATSGVASGWYPTRLIDVGPAEQHGCSPRLIVTSRTPISGPYTTLSHCWGGVKTLSLTESTLDQFLQGIDALQVPKTFLDAFKLNRALGIRYIWIDSLCIMQDSTDDWNHEAERMLKVYQHAYCNIAATHSYNCHTGLFCNRIPKAMSLVLQVRYDTFAGTFRFTRGESWGEESLWLPLNLRAWVVQERYISCRIINFGSDQIVWDCYESLASEQFPESAPFEGRSFKKHHGLLSTFTSELDFLYKWNNIIAQYSVSRLTFPDKDRVVAISSMAQHLQGLWNIEYCAGLWRKHLELQLGWSSWRRRVKKRHAKLLAPSWSWLSYDGGGLGLHLPARDMSTIEKFANAIDVQIQEGKSSVGHKILRGHVDIRCILLPLIKSVGNHHWEWIATQGSRRIECGLWLDYPDDDFTSIFFLALYGCHSENEVYGIAVTLSSEANGHYIRCGTVVMRDYISFTDLMEHDGKRQLSCMEFDEQDGYLIRLV